MSGVTGCRILAASSGAQTGACADGVTSFRGPGAATSILHIAGVAEKATEGSPISLPELFAFQVKTLKNCLGNMAVLSSAPLQVNKPI